MPLAELTGYAADLRAATGGLASYVLVPAQLAAPIAQAALAAGKAEVLA